MSGLTGLKALSLVRVSVKSFMMVGIVLIFLLRPFGSLNAYESVFLCLGGLLASKGQILTEDALKEDTLMGSAQSVSCVPKRGRNGRPSPYSLFLGVVSLAFICFLYGC